MEELNRAHVCELCDEQMVYGGWQVRQWVDSYKLLQLCALGGGGTRRVFLLLRLRRRPGVV